MFSCFSREHGDDYELIQSQLVNELLLYERADSRFQMDLGLNTHKENVSVCSILFRLHATLWSTSLAAVSGELASLHHKSDLKEQLKMQPKSILQCPIIPRQEIPSHSKALILTISLWSPWRAESSSVSELRNNSWWNLVRKNSSEKYLQVRINILLGTVTNVLHLHRWYECASELVCNCHNRNPVENAKLYLSFCPQKREHARESDMWAKLPIK